MLTLFVLPSCKENANAEKTIESFSGVSSDFNAVPVSQWRDVNNYRDKDEWFGIFWDNEYIDNNIKEALPIYFLYQNLEALILYKKESMIEAVWRYRLFRRSVYLGTDFAPTSLWLSKEVVLDGWVLEHEYPN